MLKMIGVKYGSRFSLFHFWFIFILGSSFSALHRTLVLARNRSSVVISLTSVHLPLADLSQNGLQLANTLTFYFSRLFWYSGKMNWLIWISFQLQSEVWLSKIESLKVFSYLLQLSHKATVTLTFNSENMFTVLFQVLFLCTSLDYFCYSGQTNWLIWSPIKNSCSSPVGDFISLTFLSQNSCKTEIHIHRFWFVELVRYWCIGIIYSDSNLSGTGLTHEACRGVP